MILGDTSTLGFDARVMMNWGVFPICLVLFFASFIQSDWSFSLKSSSLFQKKNREIVLYLIIGIDTLNTIFASWAVILTFRYAILSETNQGVI